MCKKHFVLPCALDLPLNFTSTWVRYPQKLDYAHSNMCEILPDTSLLLSIQAEHNIGIIILQGEEWM